MGEGNRVELPRPLIGHFVSDDVKVITLPLGAKITAENSAVMQRAVDTLLEYPDGDYTVQVVDQLLPVEVSTRRVTTLHIQIEADADHTLFDRLIERLQASNDEIRVPGASYGQTLRDGLVRRGFDTDGRALLATPGPLTETAVPVDNLVWFKNQ